MHCKACRKHPHFMAEMVGRQAAEMRDTTGRRKQMGRICKRLLSLWKRAKKKVLQQQSSSMILKTKKNYNGQ